MLFCDLTMAMAVMPSLMVVMISGDGEMLAMVTMKRDVLKIADCFLGLANE